MNNQEKFRELFMELENITLEKKDSSFNNESFYAKLNELSRKGVYPYYAEYEFLNFCRVYRNAISHEVMESKYLDFSDECLVKLERIVDILKNPIKAIDVANRNIYSVNENDKLLVTIRKMNQSNYTYVPVYEGHKLIGVLCDDVIARMAACEAIMNEETRLRDVTEYIDISKALKKYSFISQSKYLKDAIDEFFDDVDKNEKTHCVFITKTGNCEEEVMGMFTAWDIIRLLRQMV